MWEGGRNTAREDKKRKVVRVRLKQISLLEERNNTKQKNKISTGKTTEFQLQWASVQEKPTVSAQTDLTLLHCHISQNPAGCETKSGCFPTTL